MRESVMQVGDEKVLDEINAVGAEWSHGEYVAWARRQRVLRLARLGAAFEKVAQEVKGPIGLELRMLVASVDGHDHSK